MTTFPPHCIEAYADGWRCIVCGWTWPKPPQTFCPDFGRFRAWSEVPPDLASVTALRNAGLRPGGPVRGYLYRPGADQWIWLYAIDEANPAAQMTESQRNALLRGHQTQARQRAIINEEDV